MSNNWFSDLMENEVPFEDIEARADEFHHWNMDPIDLVENGYEGVIDKLKSFKATDYEKLDDAGKERMVDEVLAIYRDVDVFPIQYFSEAGVMNEIAKCIEYPAKFDGNVVSCVSGDTEYFNGKEWKRIDQYTEGDKVLQYNEDGTAELVDPIRHIHYKSDEPFYEHKYDALPTCLTASHDVVYMDEDTEELKKIKYGDILNMVSEEDEDNEVFIVPVSFELQDSEFSVNLDETLCDIIAMCYDVNKMFDSPYLRIDSLGNVAFSEEVFKLDTESRKRILSTLEVLRSRDDGRKFASRVRSEEDAKLIVSLANMTEDYIGTFRWEHNYVKQGDKYSPKDYRVFVEPATWETYYGGKEDVEEVFEEDKYCFAVPSHMLVLRRKGCMFVTGNCGAGVGTVVCNYLFPNLFDVPSQHDLTKDKAGAETAYLKFKNDEFLRRSIKFCFSYKNGCPVPTNVMGGLRLVGSTPTNFRPMNAKAIYERFAPKGGVIYDFCCVSGDTEFFNGVEWKRIDNYKKGDMVLQYNEDGTAELVKPSRYINHLDTKPFYEYTGVGIPSRLTGDHDVVYREYFEEPCQKIKFKELMDRNDSHDFKIPLCCDVKDSKFSVNATQETLRGYVKLILDGTDEDCERIEGEVFRLDRDSRLRLLKILEIDLDEFEFFEGIDIRSVKMANLVVQLCNMTSETYSFEAIKDIETGLHSISIDFDGASYLLGEDFSKVNVRVTKGGSRKYCFVVPSHMLVLRRKGVIFVTGNCGFGGRLLGCLSSKNDYRYVGTDPCTETMYNLHRLGEYIEMVTGRDDSYELHCCGSEDFRGPANSVDFAFSSPPYFDLEVYSDEETQCFNKFPVLEDWLEGYVRETIKNIHHMLKPGCCYAVNIADFTVKGGREVAYVDEWIRISTEEGMPLYDTVYLGVTARAGTKLQAAGELKKENILIFKKPL